MGRQARIIARGLVLALIGFGATGHTARAESPIQDSAPVVVEVSAPVGVMPLPNAGKGYPETAPIARQEASKDNFISFDTVIVGCTAGATAGAMAIALPVVTMAGTGIGLPASATALAGTAGIGCGVGAVSSLAAIGTAWALNVLEGRGLYLRR